MDVVASMAWAGLRLGAFKFAAGSGIACTHDHVTTLDSRYYGHANAAAAAGPVSLAHASRSGRRAGQLAP